MRVLVLGQGGREHALIRALYLSPSVTEVHVAPGSDGMTETIRHNINIEDKNQVLELCKKFSFDLVVIGPELPLVQGVSDALRQAKIPVFGPSSQAAQLEGSKVFNKEFLVSAKVPTAEYALVTTVAETLEAAKAFPPPYVLKADGLAAGKGVYICATLEDLETAATDIFVKKVLGKAGEKALLEKFTKGYELSFFILTNGEHYSVLPLAQDHKKIFEGETGPNTGGMGAVAPIPIDQEDYKNIIKRVVEPTVAHFKKIDLDYKGILFIGIMMTANGPSVLEFNVRFGDPEAQVILPLLDGDWGQVFLKIANGQIPAMKWRSLYAACVVMAAEGYPATVVKGTEIQGDLMAQTSSSYILHAGTKKENGIWTVNGGRVLGVVGLGSSLKEAVKKSYDLAETISWKGSQMRRDIGKRFL